MKNWVIENFVCIFPRVHMDWKFSLCTFDGWIALLQLDNVAEEHHQVIVQRCRERVVQSEGNKFGCIPRQQDEEIPVDGTLYDGRRITLSHWSYAAQIHQFHWKTYWLCTCGGCIHQWSHLRMAHKSLCISMCTIAELQGHGYKQISIIIEWNESKPGTVMRKNGSKSWRF